MPTDSRNRADRQGAWPKGGEARAAEARRPLRPGQTQILERGGAAMLFRDRREAGRQLAAKLTAYSDRSDVLVLALPRGGVLVAFEVARALDAPLDVFLASRET